jgi:D-glycero-D-manno-heptose 1,7-bisphosphate phosphatase
VFVLLDRDGTIIVAKNYLSKPEDVELLPGAAEAIKRLHNACVGIAIVTNQSGIARGYFDERTLNRIHDRLEKLLAAEGAFIDQIYFCPHAPVDVCVCRKPATGMIEQAAAELDFMPRNAFVVGDSHVDMQLGLAVEATPVLVMTGYGQRTADMALPGVHLVADNLVDAVDLILNRLQLEN